MLEDEPRIARIEGRAAAARARISARWGALSDQTRGALLVLAAAVLFTVMMVCVKLLGTRLDPLQVAFFRAFFGLLFIAPVLIRAGLSALVTRRPVLQVFRAVTGATALILGFYAVTYLPLADANAISFARAIFVVPLAVLVLGERAGPARWGATLIGFLGVVVMLRPSGAPEPAALIAVAAAFLVAVAIVSVKILSRGDRAVTLLFYASAFGLLVTAVPAALAWVWPTPGEWALLVAMGLAGVIAHAAFIKGYQLGEATALNPIDYTRLVFSALAGFVVFGDVPDLWSVAGAGLIVTAALWLTLREVKEGREAKEGRPQPPPVR